MTPTGLQARSAAHKAQIPIRIFLEKKITPTIVSAGARTIHQSLSIYCRFTLRQVEGQRFSLLEANFEPTPEVRGATSTFGPIGFWKVEGEDGGEVTGDFRATRCGSTIEIE